MWGYRPFLIDHLANDFLLTLVESLVTKKDRFSPFRLTKFSEMGASAIRQRLQKFLARGAMQLEDRSAMSTFARSANHGRAFVTTCVFAAFVGALALSASPQLHQRIHSDAGQTEHSCVVTAIASGSYEHASHPPLVSAPRPRIGFSEPAVLCSVWVQSLFLCAHIFAHAPPR